MKTSLLRKTFSALIFSFIFVNLLTSVDAQTQLIQNGGFESGSGISVPNWVLAGGAALNGAAGSSQYAHSGLQYLILGGAVNENDSAYQTIVVPNGATPVTLSFWYSITSQETAIYTAYDTMTVTIRNSSGSVLQTVASYSNLNKDSAPGTWHQVTANLATYAGQTIQICISSSNDSTYYTTFRIDDVSVLATVPTQNYTITVSASPSAGGTVGGGGTFASGSSRTVTAAPNSGYTFADWTENGSIVSYSSSYNFTLNANRNLVANFTPNKVNYTISLSASPSAGGTVSGGGTFASGSSQTVCATANSGYTFANWTENSTVVSSSACYSFTLNANRNLVANFNQSGGGSPLSGKGDWIHKISSAIASVPGATTFQDLINYEQSIGVKYLIVKAGEGNDPYPYSGMQLNSAFVSACHAAGIKVFGFHYVYGGAYQGRILPNGQPDPNYDNVNSSVNSEVSIAIQILDTGCDGLIIDAESAYEDFAPGAIITPGDGDPTRFYYPGTLPPSPSLPPVAAQSAATAAQAYCSGILSARPTAFLAYAPFYNPSSHSYFPYLTFGKYCAAVMPQAYYWFNGYSPESTVAMMDSQWKTLQNAWISSGHGDSVKPLFPIGYSAPPYASGADITDFVNLLNSDASPATSGGYQGVSFWDADLQDSSTWSAIASATIGSAPNPDTTAPTISAFSVTPSSVTVGNSFTASYTVSDSGGSGLKQVVLRRTSGDGSAYDPGWQDIQTVTVAGNGPVSGSFNPDTPPSAGTYWYGMAAFDNANNSKDERASGLGPLQRTVSQVNYTISVSASPVGDGTVGGGGTFVSGSSQTVTATANGGYSFINWTENGSVASSSASYTFTLNGNRNLVANFTTINYTISVSALPSAGGTVSGGGTFASGSSRTVTTTANSGYTFANWTENGSVMSSSASYTFTLNGNRNLVANFNSVDTTPPALTITSPANGAIVTSASLPVNGTASDNGYGNNGISSVTVNSVAASNDTASGPGMANWSATVSLHSGQNIITVIAADGLGNATPSQQRTVTYNPLRPVFGGLSVSGGQLQTTLSGLSVGETVVLYSSGDLKNWTPVQTKVATGSTVTFTPVVNSALGAQYFRVQVQ
jgi:hypothetical protein